MNAKRTHRYCSTGKSTTSTGSQSGAIIALCLYLWIDPLLVTFIKGHKYTCLLSNKPQIYRQGCRRTRKGQNRMQDLPPQGVSHHPNVCKMCYHYRKAMGHSLLPTFRELCCFYFSSPLFSFLCPQLPFFISLFICPLCLSQASPASAR